MITKQSKILSLFTILLFVGLLVLPATNAYGNNCHDKHGDQAKKCGSQGHECKGDGSCKSEGKHECKGDGSCKADGKCKKGNGECKKDGSCKEKGTKCSGSCKSEGKHECKGDGGCKAKAHDCSSECSHHSKVAKLSSPEFVMSDGFTLLGFEKKTTMKDNQHLTDIPAFWEELQASEACKDLPGDPHKAGMFGLVTDFKEDMSYSYIVGMKVESGVKAPNGAVKRTLPKVKYAVYTVSGPMPEAIADGWSQIQALWFSEKDFEFAEDHAFEHYGSDFMPGNNGTMKIYLPIKSM